MQLRDISILICGQRFTSRTETLENYFVKFAKIVGVIAMAGVRQQQDSSCKLYVDGKVTKEFSMSSLHLKGESLLFTFLISIYYAKFFLNFFNAYNKLDHKFQVFVGVQTWSTLLGIFLKKMGKVDRVIYYCIDYYKPTGRIGSRIETFVFRHLDRYCCKNSDMIWDLAPHFKEDRKKDFPNDSYGERAIYVPLTYSESLLMNRSLDDIDKHSMAFVGTLESEQGWEVFIKSIPIVRQTFSDFKVHIFGDGSYRPTITRLIEQTGVQDSVVMHGFIKDENELLDKLSRCAVGIAPYLPHKAEYAGLDAGKPKLYAVVGLPIIMTYTEYIESQFQKFKTGKTFRYDPVSLAETIIELINDDEKLKEYKHNANEFARRFTSEAVFPEALEKTLAAMYGQKSFQDVPAHSSALKKKAAFTTNTSRSKSVLNFWPYYIMLALAMSVFAPGIFVSEGFFNYGDFSFPFNPEKRWTLALSIMDYSIVPNRAPYYQGYLPALSVIHALDSIGVPLWLINHALLVSAAFIASVSIYHLSKTLINNPDSKVPALIGGAFAVLNPSFIYHDPLLEIAYAGIFLMLNFFILGMRNPSDIRYRLAVPVSSLLTIWSPLTFLIGITIAVSYFALYHLFKVSFPTKSVLKYFAIVSFMTFSINLFWLGVPIVLQLTGTDVAQVYTNPVSGREGVQILRQTSSAASLGDSLTLSFNNCLWCLYHYGDATYGTARVAASFLPLILGGWAVVTRLSDVNLKVFLVIAIALISLSVGIHYPVTGKVYQFLWDNVVGFKGLRDTNQIFYTMAFLFAILLALGSYHFLSIFKKWQKGSIVVFLVGLVVANGSVLYLYGTEANFAAHADPFLIPEDYPKLKEYLSRDVETGYRALILPLAGGGVTYDWYSVKKPGMNNIIIDYIPLPVAAVATIDQSNISYGDNIDASIQLLNSDETTDLAALLLGNQGIKYVVVQRDLDNPGLKDRALDYSFALSRHPDLFEKINGFTKFDVFVINERYLLPTFRFLVPDPAAQQQLENRQVPLESITILPTGSIRLVDNTSYIAMSSSNQHNLDRRFGILLWAKTPTALTEATLLSSNNYVRPAGRFTTPLPVYSLTMDNAGHLVFALRGTEQDVSVTSSALLPDTWYLIVAGANENNISLTINAQERSEASRNYQLNTIQYLNNSNIIVGKTPYLEKGASGFTFSRLVIYSEEPTATQLGNAYRLGQDRDPNIGGTILGNWDFQSPNRNPAFSGYELSPEGIQIVKRDNPERFPLTTALTSNTTRVISAKFDPVIQESDMRLSDLSYSLDVTKQSGMVILNADYDPKWKLVDSVGRVIPSTFVAESWNTWYIADDMIPPFQVEYIDKDIPATFFAISTFLFILSTALLLKSRVKKSRMQVN